MISADPAGSTVLGVHPLRRPLFDNVKDELKSKVSIQTTNTEGNTYREGTWRRAPCLTRGRRRGRVRVTHMQCGRHFARE